MSVLDRQRKYSFAVMVFLLTTVLRVFDHLADDIYGDIVIWVTGLFMAGNGAVHVAEAWKQRAKGITDEISNPETGQGKATGK